MIENLLNLFATHGVIATTISLVCVSLIWVFKKFGGKIVNTLFDKILQKHFSKDTTESVKISESDVLNHEFLNYLDFWTFSKVPTLIFKTEYRTAVFRRYLTCLLKAYKSNVQTFVVDQSYKKMDEAQLNRALLRLINDIIYKYEEDARTSGIPEVVINKMKIRNSDTLNLLLDLIDNISNSPFYDSEDNLLKVFSFQSILMSIVENILINSEPVCSSINGELKGLSFEGKTEK
jgi:hypothetical protein